MNKPRGKPVSFTTTPLQTKHHARANQAKRLQSLPFIQETGIRANTISLLYVWQNPIWLIL